MKILVEFDVPESWDHYTEEQNLHSLTNWGATNDGVAAKVITDGHSKMLEVLKEVDKLLEDYFNATGHNDRENAISGKVNSLINEIES